MTEPTEGDRYRDSAGVLWTVDDPNHHSESGQGVLLTNESSGMTLRLGIEGFQKRVGSDLVPVNAEGSR